MDEKALFKVTYGLYVVCAQAEGQRSGCVVNTLQQVTAEPGSGMLPEQRQDFV